MDDNKALLDRAPEIVAALRCMEREVDCTDCHYYNGITCEPKRLDADAVALLEAKAAQLAAVTAERDAAVEDLKSCTTKAGRCQFCMSFDPQGKWPMQCKFRGMLHTDTCPDWVYRGSQRAGEGGE